MPLSWQYMHVYHAGAGAVTGSPVCVRHRSYSWSTTIRLRVGDSRFDGDGVEERLSSSDARVSGVRCSASGESITASARRGVELAEEEPEDEEEELSAASCGGGIWRSGAVQNHCVVARLSPGSTSTPASSRATRSTFSSSGPFRPWPALVQPTISSTPPGTRT